MSFFKQFPTANYFLADRVKRVVDIFRHVDVNDILASDITNYRYEIVGDGERPDNLSQRLYGLPDYYWTFFIVNENLKNGLDDWPKATGALEKEFEREYDNMGAMVFKPFIANKFQTATGELTGGHPSPIDLKSVQGTFAGLDLDYEDLKLYRNFETASVVKWDNDRQQLFLKDFTNRSNFFGDPVGDPAFGAKMQAVEINREASDTFGALAPTKWDVSALDGSLHFTFNDWPIIGKNLENGQNFDYLSTMTVKRTDWIVHLFEWWESKLIDLGAQQETIETPLSKYRHERGQNITREQAALNVFRLYFSYTSDVGYANGLIRFAGFKPHRRVSDSQLHTFQSARNAPFCYYNSSNFIEDNKITAFDALTQFDPQHYKSFYREEQEHNFEQSRIKVIKPELINAFRDAYQEKIAKGSTIIGNSEGIVNSDSTISGGGLTVSSLGNTTSGGSGNVSGGGGGGGSY